MTQRCRIVFVQSGLGAGGAEKIINLLAHHRLERGDAVAVLAFAHTPETSFFPYSDGILLRTFESEDGQAGPGGVMRLLRRVRWLQRRLVELEPDLVVSFLTKINVITLLATFGLVRHVIVSERNNPGQQEASRFWNVASTLLLGRAWRIVMQTAAARDTLPQRLSRLSVVIPNPAALPNAYRPAVTRPREVVAVGRLSPQKGFDLLLRAFAGLDERLSDWRLSIWGEGSERDRLVALIDELGLAGRVRLRGQSAEALGWLDSGEVFVLSSRFEGFPNALIEAMAGGLAPIAFDCDWGPSDMIRHGENGLLVPNGDVAGLTSALARVLEDPDLRARLQESARHVAEAFSQSSVLRQWDCTFDTALEHIRV